MTVNLREVLKISNELDEKYVEYALRETLQLELQRVKEENKELKSYLNKRLECSKRRTDDRF